MLISCNFKLAQMLLKKVVNAWKTLTSIGFFRYKHSKSDFDFKGLKVKVKQKKRKKAGITFWDIRIKNKIRSHLSLTPDDIIGIDVFAISLRDIEILLCPDIICWLHVLALQLVAQIFLLRKMHTGNWLTDGKPQVSYCLKLKWIYLKIYFPYQPYHLACNPS